MSTNNRYSIIIGDKTFGSKSKALEFYKNILNFYDAGKTVSSDDYTSVMDLFYMEYLNEEIAACRSGGNVNTDLTPLVQKIRENFQDIWFEIDGPVSAVKVDYHPEFLSTKCFYLMQDRNWHLYSYRFAISGEISDSARFSRACRNAISDRLREFKKSRFKNRPVRCAITNEIVEWEECQIDHKAPLTFSVIVKSFVIANKIDISEMEYISEITKEQFADKNLVEKFDNFHKEMAVLRILSINQNKKLSSGARIKPTKKDGTLL